MKDLFTELLQVSLGTCDVLSRAPSIAEWSNVSVEAQRQSIACFLLDGLERLPTDQMLPQQLLLQWIGLAQMTEATYLLQCERAKELTKIFIKGGFKKLVSLRE